MSVVLGGCVVVVFVYLVEEGVVFFCFGLWVVVFDWLFFWVFGVGVGCGRRDSVLLCCV